MCKTLVHRGPDDEGIYTAPYIGLGQRRLSIIDLRNIASPPLFNEDKTISLVFNGEIYNFKELRRELKEKGHKFATATDTEVIIHLYEELDLNCLSKLRGMFAFALWDANKKRLFAARDRLGKKPLYYSRNNIFFSFGSEIKAITADPEISIEPNYPAIDDYLTYEFIPSPATGFKNIYKLPPAHFLTCLTNGQTKVERYWSPPYYANKMSLETEEIIDILTEKLQEAVRVRMVADVELGAFLSGGIDSSIIVALMARQSSKPIKTFSIGFAEEKYNELPYARQLAQRYGTDHHEIILAPNVAEVLPLLVYHYNEPFADSSALPTYYVSKITREYVTVGLSGDGGDESFGGYNNYVKMLKWSRLDVIPFAIRRFLGDNFNKILAGLSYDRRINKISRALNMFAGLPPERYRFLMSIFKPQEKKECYSPQFYSLLNGEPKQYYYKGIPWDNSMDLLDWLENDDLNFYLPDCLMMKTDIASMANSLEIRCPFLDNSVVDFAAKLDSPMKISGNMNKLILRKLGKMLLPKDIIDKPKTGFSLPIGKWFQGELLNLLRSYLMDDKAIKRGLFKQTFLKTIIYEHVQGQRDWSSRLWALLFLEIWFRQFID
jgi:asparagine synthase (glutamine-hydrolysing)